jgi:hypothetical protein
MTLAPSAEVCFCMRSFAHPVYSSTPSTRAMAKGICDSQWAAGTVSWERSALSRESWFFFNNPPRSRE